ncbi:MAG TPA: hypothetical protein P5228_04865 [Bacteroidales bacterium]|nr:hypothetical protein [Bacteroidales bacterium]HRZ50129.1 hypothetical protein [Bacteroidales bacterium]
MNRQNYRLLVWLVIILLVLNVSALGTILWFRHTLPSPPETRCRAENQGQHNRLHDAFIKEELQFDEAQMKQFIVLRDKHFSEIKEIREDIEATRKLQFMAVQEKNADPNYLDSLSSRIGLLHQKWSVSSTEFLQKASAVCNDEQRLRFFTFMEQSRKDSLQWPGHHRRGGKKECRIKQ